MADRMQRLREALPEVIKANDMDVLGFKKAAPQVWNSLRRGVSDTKRCPEVLNDVARDQCAEVWEFIMRLNEMFPRFLRQVLDCAVILVESPDWIEGFLLAENCDRLTLWKLELPRRPADPSPVDVLMKLINGGAPMDQLLRGAEGSDVFCTLQSRASEEMPAHSAYFARAGAPVPRSAASKPWVDYKATMTKSRAPHSEAYRTMDSSPFSEASSSIPWQPGESTHTMTEPKERRSLGSTQTRSNPLKTDEPSDNSSLTRRTISAHNRSGRTQKDDAPTDQSERLDNLNAARHTNDYQVNIIMSQQTQATEGLTTQKDIVDSLLDAAVQALDAACQCLKPMLMGYQGESNPAHVAKERVLECKSRLQDLSANLVIIGPCQSGKTSLCHALVGYPLLPFDTPTMIVTKWTHIVGRKAPTLTISTVVYTLLQNWSRRISMEAQLPPQITHGEHIEEALNNTHKIVHFGRQSGHVMDSELSALCQVENFLHIELAFASLIDLSDDLTDVGSLSLYDLPSPDGQIFDHLDLKMVFRRTLQQADGVLVTIDVSKHESTQVTRISELIEECVQDRLFRREDTWIVANAIDKIEDFHCFEGVATVCKRVKQEQYRNFENVILDEDHVIPTAAHLSLLALYSKHKIPPNLSPQYMNKLRFTPWFAQLWHYYFGVNWIKQMRTIGLSKWPEMVEEITLHGQVTAKLSTSVLQAAYLNMFPRSVIIVMDNMKDIVEDFLQTLDTLQGEDVVGVSEGQNYIDASELKAVFTTYFADVKKKTADRIALYLPKKDDCEEFIGLLPEKTAGTEWQTKFVAGRGAMFEDYSTAPVEDFLKKASRELIRKWQRDFQPCPEDCAELVKESHVKWERSVDHYLKKMGANAVGRKRILDATADLRITSPKGSLKTLDDEKWNALVKEQAEQVPYRKFKQMFLRTRKSYELSPYTMHQFLENLWEEWCRAAKVLIKQMILDVVRANFDDMVQAIEKVNERRDLTQLKEGIDFDFAFADDLRIILPKLANFDVEDPESVDENELERCEELCAEVTRAVNKIVLTANFGNGIDRNALC